MADNGTHRSITSRWNNRDIKGGKGAITDVGTHVPFVAYWKGHTPNGAALNELIDFTDFYTPVAEAAGIQHGKDDPVDGRSFLAKLKGGTGTSRDWVLNHYQPYWGKFAGQQYVLNENFKLYRDGSFFNIPEYLQQKKNLAEGQAGERGETARHQLSDVLKTLPPAPPLQGGSKVRERPVQPDWKNIVNPNE